MEHGRRSVFPQTTDVSLADVQSTWVESVEADQLLRIDNTVETEPRRNRMMKWRRRRRREEVLTPVYEHRST